MLGTHTEDEWTLVKLRFDQVKRLYDSMMGMPNVMVGPALMVVFEPLLRRYNSGERSDELYDAMRNVE